METAIPVKIFSDHRNLEIFMTTKTLNRRQVRWMGFLTDFNFKIHHKPGRLNIADPISRRHQDELTLGDREIMNQSILHPDQFAEVYDTRKFVNVITRNPSYTIHAEIRKNIAEKSQVDEYYKGVKDWLDNDAGEIKKLPPNSGKNLKIQFDENFTEQYGPSGFTIDPEDEVLTFKGNVYVPQPLRANVLASLHDSPLAGHGGRRKTLDLVNRNYWWPGVNRDVDEFCKTCVACQLTKPQ